ncbi:MAG TPA: sugar phosphate isomerase/epimerase [Verrucomicrobiae bacterium]|jgi:sugar phosphate isomerase/epimerase
MRIWLHLLCLTFIASHLPAADKPVGVGPSFKGPIGLQLYSLRDELGKNLPAALDRVQGFGIKYVETAGTYHLAPAQFKEMLASHGLQAISGHFPFEKYRDDIDGVIKDAKALGLKYAGCAWIPHGEPFTEKDCRAAAAVFNKAGEALAKNGIRLFYHCHGYEFQPYNDGTLFDLLLSETKPNLVAFEMDVFWIVHPGQDPVKLLEKHGKRFELMHLKDMKKGTQGDLTGHSDVRNDVALGTGKLDFPAILKAAKQAGVKWYFIEDESPTSAKQIPESLKYLEQVKF